MLFFLTQLRSVSKDFLFIRLTTASSHCHSFQNISLITLSSSRNYTFKSVFTHQITVLRCVERIKVVLLAASLFRMSHHTQSLREDLDHAHISFSGSLASYCWIIHNNPAITGNQVELNNSSHSRDSNVTEDIVSYVT